MSRIFSGDTPASLSETELDYGGTLARRQAWKSRRKSGQPSHPPAALERRGLWYTSVSASLSIGHRARFLEILEGVGECEAWSGKRVAGSARSERKVTPVIARVRRKAVSAGMRAKECGGIAAKRQRLTDARRMVTVGMPHGDKRRNRGRIKKASRMGDAEDAQRASSQAEPRAGKSPLTVTWAIAARIHSGIV